jgi:predicted transcriptional regulator
MEGKVMNQTNSDNLEKVTLDILVKIAFTDDGLEAEQIAGMFTISKPKAQYYLDELRSNGLITMSSSMVDNNYLITKEGRKFLFNKNLL